jgi:hypothetical protein
VHYYPVTMQFHELAASFRNKTDDELLRLAAEVDQLTPEGQAALLGEISRRRLDIPSQQEPADRHPETVQHAPARERAIARAFGVGEFIAEVASAYHLHWWLFVRLITPAVVIAYLATLIVNGEIRQIEPHTYWRELSAARLIQAELTLCLLRLGQYLISWLAFCLVFAAVCSVVPQSQLGGSPSIWDCFGVVRNRIGPFLQLSLLLFVLFLGMQTVAGGVLVGTSALTYTHHFRMTRLENLLLPYALSYLAILIFSRFGLAVPAFLREGCGVGKAMFRSDELTAGQWLPLAALLAKTAIAGYVAGMMPFWLAGWFFTGVRVPWWFDNALVVLSIAGVSAVEPMLFVGLTLLYEKQSALIPTEGPNDPLVLGNATVRSSA